MTEACDSNLIISKRKAINALFPYAIYLEQGGQQEMINAILRAARASNSVASNTGKFMWHQVVLYVSRLFEERSPTSLNRVIALILPYVPWDGALNNTIAVTRWAAAASAIPYTEEVGTSVIDALLQVSWVDFLQSQVPIDIWSWLKRQPSLPPICHGRSKNGPKQVAYVRRLGDIDILKSFFILLWMSGYTPHPDSIHSMERSIREDFSGAGMEKHRKDLIEQLDQVVEQWNRRSASSPSDRLLQEAKRRYTKLRDTLLELDGR